MDKFVTRKEVLKTLKVHYHTLYAMNRRNEIPTIKVGNRTLYNLDAYMRMNNATIGRRKICYCRVSSNKQKHDLKRQIEYMKLNYPTHEIISDIGSSLNFERRGLQEIMDLAVNGKIEEVVVAYKDRLARVGYDLINNLIVRYSKGTIKIITASEEKTPEEELTKDIITIMNVYVAKVNGLRRYKKQLVDEIKKK